MSNQFYNYLTGCVIEYFERKELKDGDRFNITLETNEKVNDFYNSLKKSKLKKDFSYESYSTFSLSLNGIDLIVAATVNNVTEDYLTTLRNLISGKEKKSLFEDKAILFIHNSTLDSIIGGSESLIKKGMPLNVDVIREKIKTLTNKFSIKDQEIINFALDNISENYHLDNSSIFEYENILKIIKKEEINKDDMKEFNLFYDDKLWTYQDDIKAIKERLKKNNNFFEEINLVQQYGSIENDFSEKFTDKIIKDLSVENWEIAVTYEELDKSRDKKSKDLVLVYKEKLSKITNEGLSYWDIPDGDSQVKKRKRNIIIFNPQGLNEINMQFEFEESLKNEYILKSKEITSFTSGKKLNLNFFPDKNNEKYLELTFGNDKQKYVFKILILNIKEDFLRSLQGKWKLYKKRLNVSVKESMYLNDNDQEGIINIINIENKDIIQLDIESGNESYKVVMNEIETTFAIDINYIGFTFKIYLEEDKSKPTIITGLNIWKWKNERNENFYINKDSYSEENKKIIFKGKEYFVNNDLKTLLIFENEIINSGEVYFIKTGKLCLNSKEIEGLKKIKTEYRKLVEYFQMNNTLPSLAYLTKELQELYKEYLNAVNTTFQVMDPTDKTLQKSLMRIGMIKAEDGEKEILLSPLHPLNVAYQLSLFKNVDGKNIENSIIKNFISEGLLPYIYYNKSFLYKASDQDISLEWKFYSNDNINKFNSNKAFINKLVKSKIEEFTNHFSYLFELNLRSPLKINVVNMGDCKEVLEGIFAYYLSQLNNKTNKKRLDNLLPIELYIYSEKNELTAFEEISYLSHITEIKNRFPNLSFASKEYSEEDLLNMYRGNVSFYKKTKENINYSHLTFYEMDKSLVEATYEDTYKLNTGISLGGLTSTTIPKYVGNSYKTGFGLSGYEEDLNSLINTAKNYNELARVSENQDPYEKNKVIVTAISEDKSLELEKIYDNSHWVTFVDPKVDINYFKEKNDNDLLIIHYSDKYTTTSGYDAITVTRKSKLYQGIIEEVLIEKLKDKGLDFTKISKQLINYFNAVNGDWLLTLSRNNNHSTREKISILSAVNLSLAYMDNNMIWVPISLEELLRVTGGAGLSQKDGILSAKNLGVTGKCSDDLLLIGISKDIDKPKLSIYPIEVKIGKNANSVTNKAGEQAEVTFKTFDNIFSTDNFIHKFYRNFLMQILYANINKLKLYEIGDPEGWDYLLQPKIQNKLFNDDYTYDISLKSQIGNFGIISFKKDIFSRNIIKKDSHLFFDCTETDGYMFLSKKVEEVKRYISKYKTDSNKNIEKKIDKYLDTPIEKSEILVAEKLIEMSLVEEREINRTGMKVIFGKDEYDRNLKWHPNNTNKLMHPNTGIIGTMGTGKTQFTKSLITQMYLDRKNNVGNEDLGILIFDYKGDYIKGDFVKITNAKIIEPYHLPFNPLAIYNSSNSKPLLPLHTANTIKETIAKGFKLGQVQENILKDALMDAYTAKGIHKANRSTWDKQSPTFSDVYRIFEEDENIKKDSLYAALNTIDEYELFEPDSNKTKPLYDLIDGVTVIKLSGYDQGIQNLIVAMTLDLFYSQMQTQGHSKIEGHLREITKIILVDEADNFLSQNFSSIRKILKEGREFGVGTILSTQFLNHFSTGENEYSDYIESWIVHKVAKITNKEVRNIFATNNKSEEDEIISRVSDLEKHYSLVKAGNAPVKYIKDLAFWELVKNINSILEGEKWKKNMMLY